jgi:hypothetical protein
MSLSRRQYIDRPVAKSQFVHLSKRQEAEARKNKLLNPDYHLDSPHPNRSQDKTNTKTKIGLGKMKLVLCLSLCLSVSLSQKRTTDKSKWDEIFALPELKHLSSLSPRNHGYKACPSSHCCGDRRHDEAFLGTNE